MTKRELIDLCLTFPTAYEDYPFDENAAVIKLGGNKKLFALVDEMNGRLYVTVKCQPEEADFLRGAFADVTPGYHMNKRHWNTVYVDGDVPYDKLVDMIRNSYDLVKPKRMPK